MNKYLMLFVLVGLMAGCSKSRDAEVKAYVAGCSWMAHDILDQQGMQINDEKLAEYCNKSAQDNLLAKKK